MEANFTQHGYFANISETERNFNYDIRLNAILGGKQHKLPKYVGGMKYDTLSCDSRFYSMTFGG